MLSPLKRIPKKGDGVAALGQNGAFVVLDVDRKRWTADLKLMGRVDFYLEGYPLGCFNFPR
jgi:hypothetical protein